MKLVIEKYLIYKLMTSVAASCSNDVVKATWLDQMGYTLKKQNPNWLPTAAQQEANRVAVGGGVDFYCQDPLKRPKNDQVTYIDRLGLDEMKEM